MYICVCGAVTGDQIYEAGLCGTNTLEELQEHLPVSLNCQRCRREAINILRQGISERYRVREEENDE